MIVHKLPVEQPHVSIYPLSDLHLGSVGFKQELLDKWLKMVMADEFSKVVLVGDLINNALKTSKSNVYDDTMPPSKQRKELRNLLEKLEEHGKIIGAVRGNHCKRTSDLADVCPLFDTMETVGIEHLYRPSIAIIKISLGEKNKERQFSYSLALHHGGTRNKAEKFGLSIDNLDVMITGHTHSPSVEFPAKLYIDMHNNKVTQKGYVHVVCPAFTQNEPYAIEAMYTPKDFRIPVIRLSGEKKEVSVHWY